MKELILMRHGLALSAREPGPRGDAGRKLSRDGEAQIELSSRRLKELGVFPGLIISSPFLRAVETADIAAEYFPLAGRAVVPSLAAPVSLTDTLKDIAGASGDAPSVLVIGHQPTLSFLCGLLLKTEGPPFSTGSFAYLKFPEAPGLRGGPDGAKAELVELFAPEPI